MITEKRPLAFINDLEFKFKPETTRTRIVAVICFALFLLLAFWNAHSITKELEWPHDVNLIRDIGHAQSIKDGNFFADPQYLGEKYWYNPLAPSVISFVSWVTGWDVHETLTKSGPFLNLLGPVSLFILIAYLFNYMIALGTSFAYLFLFSNYVHEQATATYLPWFYSTSLAHGLFFITLLFYIISRKKKKPLYPVVTGLLLGLTFMAHTAPAVLLALVITVVFIKDILRNRQKEKPVIKNYDTYSFLTIGIISFLVSLPFLVIIVFHYKLRILNALPVSWNLEMFLPSNILTLLGALIRSNVPAFLLGIFGLVVFLTQGKLREKYSIIRWILYAALFFFIYSYITAVLSSVIRFPRFLPVHHWMIYISVFLYIGFGLGVWILAGMIIRRFLRLKVGSGATSGVYIAIIIICAVISLGGYLNRGNREAYAFFNNEDQNLITDWILQNTDAEDVFLASEDQALNLPGAAGRKTVVTNRVFSNPYVRYEPRYEAMKNMYFYLEHGYPAKFRKLAADYKVKYVISANPHFSDYGFLHLKFKSLSFFIYEYIGKNVESAIPASFAQPYKSVFKSDAFNDVLVIGLKPDDFHEFEDGVMPEAAESWRWIESPSDIYESRNVLLQSRTLIMSRKEFFEGYFIISLNDDEKRDFIFYYLTLPGYGYSLKRNRMEKVLICRTGSPQSEVMGKTASKGYPLKNLPIDITNWANKTDSGFIDTVSLLLFNSYLENRWKQRLVNLLEKGDFNRIQVLNFLARQTTRREQ